MVRWALELQVLLKFMHQPALVGSAGSAWPDLDLAVELATLWAVWQGQLSWGLLYTCKWTVSEQVLAVRFDNV